MLTAAATGLAGTSAGAVAAAAAPLITKAFSSLGQRHIAQAQRGGESVLEEAVEASGMSADQLAAAAADSPERLLLAGTALEAGTRTVNADKWRALGRSLANGLTDDALVDPELLIVAALADIEAPHIKVLRHVAEEWPPVWTLAGPQSFTREAAQPGEPVWSAKDLGAALPELGIVLEPVIATLIRHGLLTEVDQVAKALEDVERKRLDRQRRAERTGGRVSSFPDRVEPIQARWRASSFGSHVLELLRAA